jgi:hypothetical protein
VSGAIGLAFIIRVDTAKEIDEIVASLPVWPRMVVTVTPLRNVQKAIANTRPKYLARSPQRDEIHRAAPYACTSPGILPARRRSRRGRRTAAFNAIDDLKHARVDTLGGVARDDVPLFVGQQLDVFIIDASLPAGGEQ